MSKTILVVGGAGYIGSHTNLLLLEEGYDTIVFDNLSKGHRYSIPENSTFIHGDLSNIADLEGVFNKYKIDGIIDFAASIEVGEGEKFPEKFYYNNVVNSLNLFSVARKYSVDKLVFSSTAAVYGIPQVSSISESTPTNPINVYGRTKLVIENILKDFYTAYDFKSVCLRYFNACGADLKSRTGEDHDPETHLIPIIFETVTGKRDKITIYGDKYNTPDGTCIRDYIHVMDLAKAHILALENLFSGSLNCESINLGTNKGYSVKEIIEKIQNKLETKIPYVIGQNRPGDPEVLVADNTKARDLLDWEPKLSDLDTIISTAWAWEKNKNKLNK